MSIVEQSAHTERGRSSWFRAAMNAITEPNWKESISESQLTCLRLVGEGMSSKEIAIETGLSPRTVDQYVNRAAATLGASNRREAARKLAKLETGELNKFQLKSERVEAPQKSDNLNGVNLGAGNDKHRSLMLRWVSPIGGERHDLTYSETLLEIVKVAIVTTMGFGSIVAAGAWLQTLFT